MARRCLAVAALACSAIVLSAVPPAGAQPAQKVMRLGLLRQTQPPPPVEPGVTALLAHLRKLGWQEGKNLALEYRFGGNDLARLKEQGAELVRLQVDVITTAGDLSTRAAQEATRAVPIVAGLGFPVESGFVKSLARPGGNLTGVAVISDEMSVKRLELLKELNPRLSRVAVLWDPITSNRQPRAVEAAAPRLGLQTNVLSPKAGNELPDTFDAAQAWGAEAVLVLVSPMFNAQRKTLAELAGARKLVTMYYSQAFTEAGGLIAYGPSFDETARIIAEGIDRIFRGARAGDLPFQHPTRFELDVNLKTARAQGVSIPQSILSRADRVVD